MPRNSDRAPTRDTHRPSVPVAANPPQPTEPILFTAEQASAILQVRPSWLRQKAAARAVPCRFVGKHLRFARSDLEAIADMSAQKPR
ncbi:helix-turn-helix domain-containing protein [Amycolatopsis thermoflava]|uniref:helix-turn-helix domain-containing protein n=1 Tax=Amycolatopsis thermoflava TaxID=84480 RepID=UPI003EBA8AFB